MGVIAGIRKSLKIIRARHYLERWGKRHDCPGGFGDEFYINRRFDEKDIFFDLSWTVKRSRKEAHIDSIFQRCRKELVIEAIEDIESHALTCLLRELRNGTKPVRKPYMT